MKGVDTFCCCCIILSLSSLAKTMRRLEKTMTVYCEIFVPRSSLSSNSTGLIEIFICTGYGGSMQANGKTEGTTKEADVSSSLSHLLFGWPLAPGQGEPQILTRNNVRHVAPHFVLVHLNLGRRYYKLRASRRELFCVVDTAENTESQPTLAQALEEIVAHEEQSTNPGTVPDSKWWNYQLHQHKLRIDDTSGPRAQPQETLGNNTRLWGCYHFHEQAITIDPDWAIFQGPPSTAQNDPHSRYVVANKPPGVDVLCNPRGKRVRNSLVGLYAAALLESSKTTAVSPAELQSEESLSSTPLLPAHRLDSVVSGLVCCGKTNKDTKRLVRQIELGNTHKQYLARVKWKPGLALPLKIDLPIGFDVKQCKAFVDQDSSNAETKQSTTLVEGFLNADMGDGTAVVVISIPTGRKHQIRVHLEAAGIPIANDVRYGGSDEFLNQQIAIPAFDRKDRAVKSFYKQHCVEGCDDCKFVERLMQGEHSGPGPIISRGIWLHCWKYDFPQLGLQCVSSPPSWAVKSTSKENK